MRFAALLTHFAVMMELIKVKKSAIVLMLYAFSNRIVIDKEPFVTNVSQHPIPI